VQNGIARATIPTGRFCPLDEGFRRHTAAVFDTWGASYRDALERAQAAGTVAPAVDCADAAHALVAQIEGTLSLARNSQDPATLDAGARSLRRYLDSLHRTRARRHRTER
jgi:Tetracyclin repressor-like, C-terminal domain